MGSHTSLLPCNRQSSVHTFLIIVRFNFTAADLLRSGHAKLSTTYAVPLLKFVVSESDYEFSLTVHPVIAWTQEHFIRRLKLYLQFNVRKVLYGMTVTYAPLSSLKLSVFLSTRTVAIHGDFVGLLWTSQTSTISSRKKDSSSSATSNTFPGFDLLQVCAQ